MPHADGYHLGYHLERVDHEDGSISWDIWGTTPSGRHIIAHCNDSARRDEAETMLNALRERAAEKARRPDVPAWSAVEVRASHDPWMYHLVAAVRSGMMTREQALITVLFAVVDANVALQKEIIGYLNTRTTSPFSLQSE